MNIAIFSSGLHQEFLLEWLQIQIINQNNWVYTGTVDGS